MNQQFAEWYALAQISTDHETLTRRWESVETFAGTVELDDVHVLVASYFALPTDEEGLGGIVETIREHDSTFILADRELEFRVVVAAVLEQVMATKHDHIGDAVALSIVVAAFQSLRKGHPIPKLVTSAETFLATRSRDLRKPTTDQQFGTQVPKENVEQLVQALKDNQIPQAADFINTVITIQNRVNATLGCEVKLQEKRLQLLREESDILWWLTGQQSRIGNCAFDELEVGCAALFAGRELADLTSIIPGPLKAEEFAKRILRSAFNDKSNTPIQFAAAVNAVPMEVRQKWRNESSDCARTHICPIYSGVIHSLAVDKSSEWPPLFKKALLLDAKIKCTPAALSRQMYLESLLLRTEA